MQLSLLALIQMDACKRYVKGACIRHICEVVNPFTTRSRRQTPCKSPYVHLHIFIWNICEKYSSKTGKPQNLPFLPHLYLHLLEQALHKCKELPEQELQSNATILWTSQAEEMLPCAVLFPPSHSVQRTSNKSESWEKLKPFPAPSCQKPTRRQAPGKEPVILQHSIKT